MNAQRAGHLMGWVEFVSSISFVLTTTFIGIHSRTEEAIGLSRGGMTTKLLAVVDEEGQLCHFALTAGNVHDLTFARQMLGSFAGVHFVGDKGFDSQVFREELISHGATGSTIPRKGLCDIG